MATAQLVSKQQITQILKYPFEVIAAAYKQRYAQLREELGPGFAVKKFRICKGCGAEFSAREMRSHQCTISWRKRT
jgi:hypothetical protein